MEARLGLSTNESKLPEKTDAEVAAAQTPTPPPAPTPAAQ
jgi:hypothetical protein